MKKVKIQISGVYDVTQFVQQASQVDAPGVNVYKGHMAVDGASLMGMLALDTSNGLEVEYPESAKEFDNFIQQFVR